MGNCVYCGKAAGLFRSKHAECEAQEKKRLAEKAQRLTRIEQNVVRALQHPDSELSQVLLTEGEAGQLGQSEIRSAIINGWSAGVDTCLEDGVIDVQEEHRLMALKNHFHFTEEDLDKHGAHTRLVKGLVIRDVLNGIIPQRFQLNGSPSINLQKGEQIIWAFTGCDYLEDKTKRSIQGGSRGASFRVMKGVYYRVGAFKGSPVYTTERLHVDNGTVYITNKHIYFAGPAKSLRVPYSKIVSFMPFEDGVGVVRDAQTAKPQIFKTGDGWFAYNLVTNLAQLIP